MNTRFSPAIIASPTFLSVKPKVRSGPKNGKTVLFLFFLAGLLIANLGGSATGQTNNSPVVQTDETVRRYDPIRIHPLKRVQSAVLPEVPKQFQQSQTLPTLQMKRNSSPLFKTIRSFADLGSLEAWTDDTAKLIVPGSAGGSASIEEIKVKSVEYSSSFTSTLSAISDPYTKQSYILPWASFYISDESDMFACVFSSSTLQIKGGSVYKAPTSADGDTGFLARFISEVDDIKLSEKQRLWRDAGLINLGRDTPFQFWTRDSSMSSQPATPSITSVDVSKGILQLDLLSDGGKYKGTFWVDLKEAKFLRSTFQEIKSR